MPVGEQQCNDEDTIAGGGFAATMEQELLRRQWKSVLVPFS